MSEQLFSLRMRAAQGGKHISGAERIVLAKEAEQEVNKLIKRALKHSRGSADYINLTLEVLKQEEIKNLSSLPITTIEVATAKQGRAAAKQLLTELGISAVAVAKAFKLLSQGANPAGGNMRGAMLMKAKEGERLLADQYRGVRATKFDYKKESREELVELLATEALNTSHLPEALALATKVNAHPAVKAELCYSDDPDYTAGYVASQQLGYCRFSHLKSLGSPKGGRVFFVDSDCDLEELIAYLEKQPVLIATLNNQLSFYNSVADFLNASAIGGGY